MLQMNDPPKQNDLAVKLLSTLIANLGGKYKYCKTNLY